LRLFNAKKLDLLSYCQLQDPDFEYTNHHKLIARHLQKIEMGEINRLAIFLPPRYGKTYISQMFSSWYMGNNPTHNFIYAAYNNQVAQNKKSEVRELLSTTTHNVVFPEGTLKGPVVHNKLEMNAGGTFTGIGACSALCGVGADVFLIDDPIADMQQASSDIMRNRLEQWVYESLHTRLMIDGKLVLIMTRWRDDDIASYMLDTFKDENWTILNFPAIAVDRDILGRKVGEALCPNWFSPHRIEELQSMLKSDQWNALYQQNPNQIFKGMELV